MEETIDLKELFAVLKKKALMILLLGIIAALAAFGHSRFLVTPLYRSTAEIIVNNSGDDRITQQDIQSSLNLINTYRDILTRQRILEPVINDLNLNYSVGALRNMMSVNQAANSQLLAISVTHQYPAWAQAIANAIVLEFEASISEIMDTENTNVSILTHANFNRNPVNANAARNGLIGAFAGVSVGVFIALMLHYLDTTVKNDNDVKNATDWPVLGMIPEMSKADFVKKEESHV